MRSSSLKSLSTPPTSLLAPSSEVFFTIGQDCKGQKIVTAEEVSTSPYIFLATKVPSIPIMEETGLRWTLYSSFLPTLYIM